MPLLLIYGATLLLAVLVSEWSRRTVLSSAVLFLAIGFAVGPAGLSFVGVSPGEPLVSGLTDLALVSILFSDGMKLDFVELRERWHLPVRALLLAMPATALVTALGSVLLFHLSWAEALLLGAMLSPTDPVFAAAIVGREDVPARVRHLLNIESGVNDGLALPFVLGLAAIAGGDPASVHTLVLQPFGGLACGGGIAVVAGFVRRSSIFRVAAAGEPIYPLAVAIVTFATASLIDVNEYLAAFAAGATLGALSPASRGEYHDVGERLSELLKLAAVLVIAITLSTVSLPGWRVPAFAVFMLLVPRTVPLLLALVRTPLSMPERLVAAWFGPRGFASLLYALIVLGSGAPHRELLFQIVTATVLLSIVLHSSTDVPIAHRLAASQTGDEPASPVNG